MLNEPDYVLTPSDLDVPGYFVYAWMRGQTCLYVGTSSKVLTRLHTHETIGKAEPLQPTDEIRLFQCDSRHRMLGMEAYLTSLYRPAYNRKPNGYRHYRPERASRVECLSNE